MCEKRSNFLEGLITGAVLGIGAYLFYKSDDGQKVAKKLKKQAEPYLDDLTDLLDEIKDQSTTLLDKAEEVKEALEDKLEEGKNEATEVITDKMENSLSSIEALQERGRQATAHIRKRFFKNTKKTSS